MKCYPVKVIIDLKLVIKMGMGGGGGGATPKMQDAQKVLEKI